jgi:phage shock protein E
MIRGTSSTVAGSHRKGSRATVASPRPDHRRRYVALVGGIVAVAVMAIVAAVVVLSAPSSGSTGQTVVHVQGGTYTNVTADRLAQMLKSKDFTLVNVKTPYSDEIDGTDLYIPYDQLSARAAELPSSKSARILVYCLTGRSSLVAVQTLLDLGYTKVWNLDGGMNAWTSSGRTLIHKNR